EATFRVWLVRDGDVLYVDKNGNGDLTEKDERCLAPTPADEFERKEGIRRWSAGDLLEADGKTKHTALRVRVWKDRFKMQVMTNGQRSETVYGEGLEGLEWAERPQDAPIVHFAGPLSVQLHDYFSGTLTRGQADHVWVGLGSPGLGKGTFALITDDELYYGTK